MSWVEEWRQILLSAFRHRTRTLLTAFGVFWGIFMLVILLGIGKGLERGVSGMFKDDAVNSVWISARSASMPFQGLNAGRVIRFGLEDLHAIETSIPGLSSITPRHAVPLSRNIRSAFGHGSFPVLGIFPGYHRIEKNILRYGRFINRFDIDSGRRVAVIGWRVAQLLFELPAAAVGQSLDIAGISFKVVGVFHDSGGESELRRIFLPYTALAKSIDASGEFSLITFITEEPLNPQWLDQRLRKLLGARHSFDRADQAAISIFNANEQFRKFKALFAGITLFITVVGLGTLFAGLVSVSNIMMISVKERKREIGLRKAIGATPRSIQLLVLKESLLITAVSGYLGLAFGVVVIEGIRWLDLRAEFFRDPEVNLVVAACALLAIIVGGALAGFIPARQAALTSPIEALRHD